MSTNIHAQADHGLSHVMSPKLLIGVLATLVLLTLVTVVTATQPIFNFGAYPNLIIAMVIATTKATLVCLFFMHLLYDRKFNLVIFMGSLLFVLLFVSVAMMDTGQYQGAIERRVDAQIEAQAK
ncbi:MAG: cytochrome C oxidase subunit IV family protein [Clostridia bacterium]|nr:cytochrome C oxidase subunit IV family protein [Deltaproteobacteria bacterium]